MARASNDKPVAKATEAVEGVSADLSVNLDDSETTHSDHQQIRRLAESDYENVPEGASVETTSTPRDDNPEFCKVCGAYRDENHAHLVHEDN